MFLEAGVDHVTCFDQWNVGISVYRGLQKHLHVYAFVLACLTSPRGPAKASLLADERPGMQGQVIPVVPFKAILDWLPASWPPDLWAS